MSTSYGKNIKLTVYGGSHDAEIGTSVTGLPKGFAVDMDELYSFMSRRAPGKNRFSTQRREPDVPIFLSGMDGNILNGEKLKAVIRNTNQRSSDYNNLSFVPRPSHADFAAREKYGNRVLGVGGMVVDVRDYGRGGVENRFCLGFSHANNLHGTLWYVMALLLYLFFGITKIVNNGR